jgi:translation initiation factor 1A
MGFHFLLFSKYKAPQLYTKSILVFFMGKRKVLNESELKEIRLPEEGELLGRVIKLLGSDQVLVKCSDDLTRRGRIRGKLKRRIWIRDNDIVIIAPWDFKESERGDIVWRFTLGQVDWLKQNGHLPKDF